ncbi:unnamed protein product [Lymnaea stagnalis]|uniref:TRPM SLOG domain-containing protein n=1 Tax=Lymnaea stagnalis TaxID=6523 RepID=A0AAV2INZ8_LYMST
MKEMKLFHSSVQQGNSCDEPTCTTTQFVNASNANVIGNQREENCRLDFDNGSKYLFLHRTRCEPLNLTSELGLDPPSLVVSIEGQTDADLGPDIQKAVRRGLHAIARDSDHSIEPWVITDGKKGGINQAVGHAARDSYGNIVVIGVDEHPVPGERRASCENLPSVAEVASRLDPNHSHFIVWSTNDNPRAINVRTQVEEGLLNIKNFATKTTVPSKIVPTMCLLVVGDNLDAIERLCTRVKHGVPAVIMKGSGRAANLIADVYKDHGLETTQRRTKELIQQHLSPCKDSQTVERHLKTLCDQYRDLITVYDAKDSSAQDFDAVLLQTSLNGKGFSKIFKLHRMIEWGRLDLFKSFVSSDQVSIKPEELKQLLWFAIAENKVEFVELFLERGAILDRYQVSSDETDFPKLADVITLYNNVPEDSLLGKLLVNAKRGQVNWSDIGSLITRLIGDFYVSPYGDATSDPDPRGTGHRTTPVTDLFTWALLMNHFELSLIFWRMQKESFIASSVFAFALLGGQKQILGCPGKRQLKENANNYQRLAIQMVEECWNSDRDKTIQLLTTKNPLWGNVKCWYLALRSKNKYFLAQKACMQIRKDLWKPVQWHILAKLKNWMFDRQRILENNDTSTL